MNSIAPRVRLALLLAALVIGTSGCLVLAVTNARKMWEGPGAEPGARVLFEVRLPTEANAARLRVQVHDFGEACPPTQTNYHFNSFEGFVSRKEPPYAADLVAGRRVWLNFVYYDERRETKLLVGFELEENGNYVALYQNDGELFGFALTEAESGEPSR